MENSINTLKRFFVLYVYTIIRFIVILQLSTAQDVLSCYTKKNIYIYNCSHYYYYYLPSFTPGKDNFPNLGKSISSIVTQSGRTVTDASLILICGYAKNKTSQQKQNKRKLTRPCPHFLTCPLLSRSRLFKPFPSVCIPLDCVFPLTPLPLMLR